MKRTPATRGASPAAKLHCGIILGITTMRFYRYISLPLSIVVACAFLSPARADEGMWLLDDLPKELLAERHGFVPSDQWAEHVMLSSLRFSSGGSASFVSSNGLVLTNHHVAADT